MFVKHRLAAFGAILIALLFSNTAAAVVGSATGTVQQIYTYGDGRVLVTGFFFSGMSCTNNGAFWIDGNHPNLARILANVMTAKASGFPVTVVAKTDNCWYPEITVDPSTYVIVGP